MKDPNAIIWSTDGTEMILLDNPPRGKCLEDLHQWLDAHCQGEWIVTPAHVGFENPTDATLFKLGFA